MMLDVIRFVELIRNNWPSTFVELLVELIRNFPEHVRRADSRSSS